METKSNVRNDLLKRSEVVVVLNSEGNPGLAKVKEEVAKGLKSKPEMIVVNNIKSHFGTNDFVINACVYDSEEQLNLVEPRKKEKKK